MPGNGDGIGGLLPNELLLFYRKPTPSETTTNRDPPLVNLLHSWHGLS